MKNKVLRFVETVPGWLTIPEGSFLEKIVQTTDTLDGAVVEIGSFCGKSTIWLAQYAKKVYAIDPHQGVVEEHLTFTSTYKQFISNLKKARVLQKVKPLVTTSQEAAQMWEKKIRVLFIDGLHDTKHAELDFALWSPHVVEGGIIAIHDSFKHWCGSEKVAVQRIVWSPEFYKIGIVDSIIYGIKGKGGIRDKINKLIRQIFIISSIEIHHVSCLLSLLIHSVSTQ